MPFEGMDETSGALVIMTLKQDMQLFGELPGLWLELGQQANHQLSIPAEGLHQLMKIPGGIWRFDWGRGRDRVIQLGTEMVGDAVQHLVDVYRFGNDVIHAAATTLLLFAAHDASGHRQDRNGHSQLLT